MRKRGYCFLLAVAILTLAIEAGTVARQGKEARSGSTLTKEQFAVYKSFLDSHAYYLERNFGRPRSALLLGRTKYRLTAQDLKEKPCLASMEFEEQEAPLGEFQEADAKKLMVKLHQRNTGEEEFAMTAKSKWAPVLLSNIVFDKAREYAVIHYLTSCGPSCAMNGIAVLKKKNGFWGLRDRGCAMKFL